jgi:hypothetical protein
MSWRAEKRSPIRTLARYSCCCSWEMRSALKVKAATAPTIPKSRMKPRTSRMSGARL